MKEFTVKIFETCTKTALWALLLLFCSQVTDSVGALGKTVSKHEHSLQWLGCFGRHRESRILSGLYDYVAWMLYGVDFISWFVHCILYHSILVPFAIGFGS